MPLTDDIDAFKHMSVNVYCRFLNESRMTPSDKYSHLSDHFDSVKNFANQNPAETGTCRYRFEDDLRSSTLRQAKPCVYNKTATLMVLVDKDITLGSYFGGKTFFEDGGQASNLTAGYLRRPIRLDPAATGFGSALPLVTEVFPVVNLWQWLRRNKLQEATNFLREYFTIVRPIMSVSFSTVVNEITKADVNHHCRKQGPLVAAAYDLSVQYYGFDHSGEPDPESAFINIVHIHPGCDNYRPTNHKLARVLDLT